MKVSLAVITLTLLLFFNGAVAQSLSKKEAVKVEELAGLKTDFFKSEKYQLSFEYTLEIASIYKKNGFWKNYLDEIASSCRELGNNGVSAIVQKELISAIDEYALHADTSEEVFRSALQIAGDIYYINGKDKLGAQYLSRLHNLLVFHHLDKGTPYTDCMKKLVEMAVFSNHPRAMDYILEIYHYYKQINDPLNLARAYSLIANAILLTDWPLANQLALETEKIFDTAPNIPWKEKAKNYKILGQTYSIGYQDETAIEYYKKALELALSQDPADYTFACEIWGNLSSVFLNINQADSALKYSYLHQKWTNKLFGSPNHYTTDIQSNLARSYLGKGNLDSALHYFDKAISFYTDQNGEKGFKIGSYHYFKAEIYIATKEYEKGLASLEQSMMSFVDGPANTSDYTYLPPVKNFPLIRAVYQAAYRKLFVFRKLFEADSNTKWLSYGYEHNMFIDSIESILQLSNTIKSYKSSLASSKDMYATAAKNAFELYQRTGDEAHFNGVFHLASVVKARSLAFDIYKLEMKKDDEIHEVSIEPNPALKGFSLESELKKLEAELVSARSNKDTGMIDSLETSIIDKKIHLLVANQETRREQTNHTNIDLNRFVVNTNDIVSHLDKNSALIEYTVHNEKLFVFCFTNEGASGHFEIIGQDFYDQLMLFRKELKSGSKVIASDLSNYLLSSIIDKLKGKDHLIIIPDDKLLDIPFECLTNPMNHQMMIHDYVISYHYSSALWLKSLLKSNPDVSHSIALFAPGFENDRQSGIASNNIYRGDSSCIEEGILRKAGNHLSPLPYSIKEVNTISNLLKNNWSTQVFIKRNACESVFREQLSNNSILHIATHGLSSRTDYELSGLFFNQHPDIASKPYEDDGFLFVSELFSVDLNADLVVLSACKSGMGKIFEGEGIYGLPRGFIYAGVPNLIVSLWKVHDEKTMKLMVEFYKQIGLGMSYAESLHAAKLYMIEKGELPLDWAGIIMIGK